MRRIGMRILLIGSLLIALTACGQATGGPAADPDEPMPAAIPAADGEVRTRGLATVMDTGSPELCLGPVAESFPPQCQGIPLRGWDWKGLGRSMHETSGRVRWGQYAVTGTFDGKVFTAADAIPAALYDTMPPGKQPVPRPSDLSAQELDRIEQEVRDLPGYTSTFVTPDGNVLVDVVFDDGSLQDWATAEYGRDVVVVTSALVPTDNPAPPTGEGMPQSIPPAEGLVGTTYAVTVLEDDSHGPQLCLGGVRTSLPPQCGGPDLVGWDWEPVKGHFKERGGVRWGDFHVVGRFDGRVFSPTRITPAADFVAPSPRDTTDFTSPCPEPEGGWRVLDPARTTYETQDATLNAAGRLPGYAGAWVDQSRNTSTREEDMNDPSLLVINVRVTEDVEGAERTLRETWGGMLCVSGAKHTEAELRRIQQELTELPGMSGASVSNTGTQQAVAISVAYDDGSLQAWADQAYGEGLVRIDSALVPAE